MTLRNKYVLGIIGVVVIIAAILLAVFLSQQKDTQDPQVPAAIENHEGNADEAGNSNEEQQGQDQEPNEETPVEEEEEEIDLTVDLSRAATGVELREANKEVLVQLSEERQTIRGFGGMNHAVWIPDLTPEQRDTAFGNGEGQLGFSILRIPIDSKANWIREVETAKRAIELGAIVFAAPWNPPAHMTERFVQGHVTGSGTVYEAESKAILSDAKVEDAHDGFKGTGYVVFENDSDAAIQWNNVIIGVEGMKNISFRYALESGTAKLDLYLNDQLVKSNLEFPATGGWDKWEEVSFQTLMRVSNEHQIKLVNKGSGSPHIDYLEMAAFNGTEGKRLRHDMYGEYADYLNEFIDFMKEHGVDIYAISIQNEPDYAYDWTWWTADEIVRFLKEYGSKIKAKVVAPESFQYIKSMSDPILNDPEALANMDILGAHLYGTRFTQFPYPLFKEKGEGKELWMTEVYYPNSDMDSGDRWPEALEIAHHMHQALVEGEFQAYIWWYIRRGYGPMREDGTISKRGYMMTHYSKFVRPGYVRVEAEKMPAPNVYTSAYKGDGKVVIVAVNKSTYAVSTNFVLDSGQASVVNAWMSDGYRDLAEAPPIEVTDNQFEAVLPPQSVVTFVAEIEE